MFDLIRIRFFGTGGCEIINLLLEPTAGHEWLAPI